MATELTPVRARALSLDGAHVSAARRGTDILGNALLCVLHRDTSPVLPVPVVHLTCAALGCSSATLEVRSLVVPLRTRLR